MWDCRLLHSDSVLSSQEHQGGVRGSSVSSRSREGRNWIGSSTSDPQYSITAHHHSVSDGALSFSDSPPDNNIPRNRWTSPLPKFHLGELSSVAAGGSRAQASWCPRSAERRYPGRPTVAGASPSLGSSSSPLSEFGQWESTSSSKQRPSSAAFFNSRRSHVSKAVYPLMFRNPVSDCETLDTSSLGRMTPGYDEDDSPPSLIEYKFQKTLMDLQKSETSPSTSSRRDGFRWSSASSSYDLMGAADGDSRFDMAEHQIDLENPKTGHAVLDDDQQKCGVCSKLLRQKSPWSTNRIMRGGDMPTAGVLPCRHVFHAECLEQLTPKMQIHDPPCPMCLKTTIGAEGNATDECAAGIGEPLQVALRSIRRSKGPSLFVSDTKDEIRRRKWPSERLSQQQEESESESSGGGASSSSLANRLKKHFGRSRGKAGGKVLQRAESSST